MTDIKKITKINQLPMADNPVDLRRTISHQKSDVIFIDQSMVNHTMTNLLDQLLFQEYTLILISGTSSNELPFHIEKDSNFFRIYRSNLLSELPIYLNVINSTFPKIRKLKQEVKKIEDKFKETKLVNEAKLLLITKGKMNEQESYDYIRKMSMNERVSKARVAKKIIEKLK
jgi:response regulator NasT